MRILIILMCLLFAPFVCATYKVNYETMPTANEQKLINMLYKSDIRFGFIKRSPNDVTIFVTEGQYSDVTKLCDLLKQYGVSAKASNLEYELKCDANEKQ